MELDKQIEQWFQWDKNEETRSEITELVKHGNREELQRRMSGRQTFGTAGIRAKMVAGFNGINDLVVIQTAQGLLRYLQGCVSNLQQKGILIGFDGRHHSERFAKLIGTVFATQSIKVFLFSKMVPTPLVSYGVRLLKCAAGVMVTASHNPKHDNGLKVYWNTGAQVLSPHDKGIFEEILKNLEPWPHSWDLSLVHTSVCISDPLEKVLEAYYSENIARCCYRKSQNTSSMLKFTFTPFHGVGFFYFPTMFERFGFSAQKQLVLVEEQLYPDPDFPSVRCPNPEEGLDVLQLAIKAAEEASSLVILATDPDADRFQLAEKNPVSGVWRAFSGNEIGSLLAWWKLTRFRERNSANPLALKNAYLITSAVSSRFLKTLAEAEGVNYEETLTGFKWMGNRAVELYEEGKQVLLAFEESIGYMCGCSFDKDGVVTASIFAEYAEYLHSIGRTFASHLEELYCTYGYHLSYTNYFLCYDPAKLIQIFDGIRNHSGIGKYVEKIADFQVKHVRDLGTGFDSSMPYQKAILPWSASSLMITFTLEEGSVLTIRASGTEPKLKYYLEVKTGPGESCELAERKLQLLKQGVVGLLKPDENRLIQRS